MKPTLFIGSSSESLEAAYAAQRNLEDIAEVVVWTQGIFELTKSFLESLLLALDDAEFSLFIFGPDDVMKIRGEEMRTARDNVVFELGLFIGRLGRERSFILMPRGVSNFHLPSDLLGIATATYELPSRSDRLQAALGPACYDIRTAMRKELSSRSATNVASATSLLVPLILPESERNHLINLSLGKTQGYIGSENLRSQLRHLRSVGLIRKHTGRNIAELTSGDTYELAEFVELTELGELWVAKLGGTP